MFFQIQMHCQPLDGRSLESQPLQARSLRYQLQQALGEAAERGNALLILAAGNTGLSRNDWNDLLRMAPVAVCGGIFPAVVYEGQIRTDAIITAEVPRPVNCHVVRNLSAGRTAMSVQLKSLAELSPDENRGLIFFDGKTRQQLPLLSELFNYAGAGVHWVGGGTGDQTKMPRVSVITPLGLLENAACVLTYRGEGCTQVASGWNIVDGPFLVTRSEGDRILSINHKPAATFYRQKVQQFHDGGLSEQEASVNFDFPLGFARVDSGLVVRDPVATVGNALCCIGDVPANSLVYLLNSSEESLIQASVDVLHRCRSIALRDLAARSSPQIMTLECFRRRDFLSQGQTYAQQALQVAAGSSQVFGALTNGEVATAETGGIEFHTKSMAITVG